MPRLNAKLKFFPIRHFSKAKQKNPADYKINEGAVQKFESLIDCGGTQTPVLATELYDYVVPLWLRGQDSLKTYNQILGMNWLWRLI